MNRSSWLNLAAVVAAITVVSIVSILAPMRTPALLCAALLLALAVAFLFLWPGIGARDGESARLAMLGPVGSLSLAMLAAAGAAVAAALAGHDALSFALDVLAAGGGVTGLALARAGAHTVTRHAQVAQAPSIHGQWQSRVGQLVALCADEASRVPVARLADALRYAARDVHGHTGRESARIDAAISDLERGLHERQSAGALAAAVADIEAALARRELELKSLRSKV